MDRDNNFKAFVLAASIFCIVLAFLAAVFADRPSESAAKPQVAPTVAMQQASYEQAVILRGRTGPARVSGEPVRNLLRGIAPNVRADDADVADPSPLVAPPPPVNQPITDAEAEAKYTSYELELVERFNRERTKRGMSPLVIDDKIMATARAHCYWMAARKTLRHGNNFPDSEIIAWNQRSPAEAVASWMNSRGHRAAILGGYRYVGVAAYKASNGSIYWCGQFKR